MRCGVALAMIMNLALAGCVTDGGMTASAPQLQTATFAFESIDGPPPEVFHTLVQALSVEAETQQAPVVSREAAPTYRVRGYLAAAIESKQQTAIAWAFDVYDAEGRRVRRVTGTEKAGTPGKNAWNAADNAVLRRVAKASLEQLSSGLAAVSPVPAPPQSSEVTLALATE